MTFAKKLDLISKIEKIPLYKSMAFISVEFP